MQAAPEVAVKRTDMAGQAVKGVRNLFMISEPEAAAEWIISKAKR